MTVGRRVSAAVAVITLLLAGLTGGCSSREGPQVVTASKSFTESVILGELLAQLAATQGVATRHRAGLGGTQLVFNALVAGDVDAYVEYTGTLRYQVFASLDEAAREDLEGALAALGIGIAGELGFGNHYALGMPEAQAEALGIRRLSDLAEHPALVFRFSSEFMGREDGWTALRERYALPQTDVRGVEHDIAYRAVAAGRADVTDVYTTDAEIAHYGLRALEDDLGHFPRYDAVLLYRLDLAERSPAALTALRQVLGRLDEAQMTAMNAAVKLEGRAEAEVAAAFLREELGLDPAPVRVERRASRVLARTAEHLFLVGLSLGVAVLVAVPLGIFAARRPRLGQAVLGVVGVGQTIPALALLVIMVPVFGIGPAPALVALFVYSLLPIVRNTHAGLTGIAPSLIESAEALGLPSGARLWRIELPLAAPTVLAGIKTAAVINVGGATLGALVGAGGYGQPILTGIRLDDTALILEGAVPAALLALLVQVLFERGERALLPGPRFRRAARLR
ncbi:MAG: ABC transporter permease subunit [Gammaproteobacteria bacterium]|nr:ABC transporter permease subunit [Gammaproteobacteria bacterium]